MIFDYKVLISYDRRMCYWKPRSSYTIVRMGEDNTFAIYHDADTKKLLAGPFDSLDAAKAAYLLLMEST